MSDPQVVSGPLTLSSGTTESLILQSGAVVSVVDTALVDTVTISGGQLYIGKSSTPTASAGTEGTVSNVTISGGNVVVQGGGLLETVDLLGGTPPLLLRSGGVVSGLTIEAGASEEIRGGVDSGATILLSATQTLYYGSAVSATVNQGQQQVNSGTTAIGTQVIGGGVDHQQFGTQVVANGGVARETTVQDYGNQVVSSGGSAVDTTLVSGGQQTINDHGLASNTTVSSGGTVTVNPGGSLNGGTVLDGGTLRVMQDSSDVAILSGVTVESGGVFALTGDVSQASIQALTLMKGAGIHFEMLDYSTEAPIVTVSGSTVTVQGEASDGTAITQAFTLTGIDGSITADEFQLVSDGDGGTNLTYVACYCLGTLIATENGPVSVEKLALGNRVRTLSGEFRPIRWIGRRSYAAEFVRDNRTLRPVTIRAGALADNVPERDLRVSPLHAMYLDNVLVPASALINGRTIVQETVGEAVEYFHVELESHDVILAEGAPSESYVEDGARGIFHNAAEFYALYPEHQPCAPVYCAPRIEGGEGLIAIWNRLNERAIAREAASRVPPVTLPPAVDAERCRGVVDHLTAESINGWAWNAAQPNEKVVLDIVVDGVPVGSVVAADYRADLVAAGIGTGWAGFRFYFPVPLNRYVPHDVQVRYAGTDVPLEGSPRRLAVLETFDGDLHHVIERAVRDLSDAAGQKDALEFMLRQADVLKQKIAEMDGHRQEMEEQGRARRLAGAGAAGMMPVRRALVITETMPQPEKSSEGRIVLSHVRALRRLGYDVTFAAVDSQIGSDMLELLEAEGVSVVREPVYASPEEVLRRQSGTFELVYLRGLGVAASYAGLARRYMTRARLVFSTRDLGHLAIERQAQVEGRKDLNRAIGRLRTYIITTALMCDQVIVHSVGEQDILRRLVPALPVTVVPWDIAPTPVERVAAERSGVAFLGNFETAASLDAAMQLAQEIMPRVWDRLPHVPCYIAGRGRDSLVRLLAREADATCGGVQILGAVNDPARDLFAKARLGVVPQRFGAGIAGKVVETFAAGLPCIMSEVAADSLELPSVLAGLVRRSVDEIVQEIIRLHEQPAHVDDLGRQGCRMVEDSFSREAVERSLGVALGFVEPVVEKLRA